MVRVLRYVHKIFMCLMLVGAIKSSALSVKVLSEVDVASFSVINESISHGGTDASIRKVTDGTTIYILKQIVRSDLNEQWLLINDCIASTVGCEVDVPLNEVFFIPYFVGSHLKMYPERAATLHMYVPGYDVESMHPQFLLPDFSVHQRVINTNSVWQKQYPLAVHKQGLSVLCIESMSLHESLPLVVALDTFVGNGDRSKPNLFYDEKSNYFYGIDHAAAFSKQLPLLACERLKELVHKNYFKECNKMVIQSMRKYRDTLQELYMNNKPFVMIEAMHTLVFSLDAPASYDRAVQERLEWHSTVIKNNYAVTKELIALLDQIVVCY